MQENAANLAGTSVGVNVAVERAAGLTKVEDGAQALGHIASGLMFVGDANPDDAARLGYPPSMKKTMSTTLARV